MWKRPMGLVSLQHLQFFSTGGMVMPQGYSTHFSSMEGCSSGLREWSAKPLCESTRTEGSNPSPSTNSYARITRGFFFSPTRVTFGNMATTITVTCGMCFEIYPFGQGHVCTTARTASPGREVISPLPPQLNVGILPGADCDRCEKPFHEHIMHLGIGFICPVPFLIYKPKP